MELKKHEDLVRSRLSPPFLASSALVRRGSSPFHAVSKPPRPDTKPDLGTPWDLTVGTCSLVWHSQRAHLEDALQQSETLIAEHPFHSVELDGCIASDIRGLRDQICPTFDPNVSCKRHVDY